VGSKICSKCLKQKNGLVKAEKWNHQQEIHVTK